MSIRYVAVVARLAWDFYLFDNLHYQKVLSKLGINAYLHKSSSAQDLIATIYALSREPCSPKLVQGGILLSPNPTRWVRSEHRRHRRCIGEHEPTPSSTRCRSKA